MPFQRARRLSLACLFRDVLEELLNERVNRPEKERVFLAYTRLREKPRENDIHVPKKLMRALESMPGLLSIFLSAEGRENTSVTQKTLILKYSVETRLTTNSHKKFEVLRHITAHGVYQSEPREDTTEAK
jgi:hypothetical protein